MRAKPDANVLAWLNRQTAETLYLSSVTLAELIFGMEALPTGRRKKAQAQTFDDFMGLFKDRVLPFDADAAQHYARLALAAGRVGRGFPTPDGYIAAIAASRTFIVASRDTGPYEAAGIAVINPWQA